MNSVMSMILIIIFFALFLLGARLGYLSGEDEQKREAVKVGHAFYTNDVNGASVWAWKTVKD